MLFRDQYYFLSNMYPVMVEYDGYRYKCVESAFQAQKTDDKLQFVNLDGYKAKKLGRRVQLTTSEWDRVKINIMYRLLLIKFSNPDLAMKLVSTGDVPLIEHNYWHDTFWGVDVRTNTGYNVLGKLLMKIRDKKKGEMACSYH